MRESKLDVILRANKTLQRVIIDEWAKLYTSKRDRIGEVPKGVVMTEKGDYR